jgi:hypothetical protein
VEYFADIKKLLKDDAIITTYSIATPVRLSMYKNGLNIYNYKGKNTRGSTIASPSTLPLEQVDMELKLQRNPSAKAIYDSNFNCPTSQKS